MIFSSRTTGLPSYITMEVAKNDYIVRIMEDESDEVVDAVFRFGANPICLYSHLPMSINEQIENFIQRFYPAMINLVDGKIDEDEFAMYVIKERNAWD